ncbi:MAG: copper-translocating P-type ATPase [Chitinophagales bacterium]|nr:copper-translocating P-type ATPase [Chitinophagales bacterium]
MTKITINIDTEGENEPKVTTTTENPNTDVPKAESPVEEKKEATPKEDSPKEEKKEETSSETESAKEVNPKKEESKMSMTDEEHKKMNADKTETSKEEATKTDHSKLDMTAEEHSKMQHGNAPMGHAGHDHHKMIADFRLRFFICLGLSIPIMILSPMLQMLVGINWQFPGSQYVAFALSTVVFFYGGFPFLKGFWNEVKSRTPGMMILIAVAISTAYIYSTAIVFGLKGEDFFWELATLITIMLLGHWLEMKSIAGASRELELLVQLMPDQAHLVSGDKVSEVKTDSLKEGDIILIKPGEKIAADGLIAEGESYLNESMLTGESVPVKKTKGQKVIAGSINGNGSIKVTVTHASKDSYLSKVVKLVDDAQKSKSKTQLLADRAALVLTIAALTLGFGTFAFWLIYGETLQFALERMVTVIIISCPHALGLAVPLVVAISTALSAKNGLLIKNRTAFENSRKITTIIFDKTGTLTIGKFEVARIVPLSFGEGLGMRLNENEIIRIASALEQNSEHPIATGILAKAKELSLTIPIVNNFKAITGKGIEAEIEGKNIKVVSPGYLKENNISLPENYAGSNAETIVFIMVDGKLAGYISLGDKIRPESAEAIQTLHDNNIKSILLTGDNAIVAKSVSDELKMDGYFAEVLPDQKLEKIKELQAKGEFVAMTGDGVNDAPALAQADIGIAVGSGSDIAAETAGIILVNSNPKDIASLILFGKATYRKMIQNLIWATGYNVVAIPLAAGVLYKWGILLTPAVGAVFMSVSTIVVAINAKMLRVKTVSKKDEK